MKFCDSVTLWAVCVCVLVTKITAVYSFGHELHSLTAVPSPSYLPFMLW